ncbi:hypothetical protein B0A50_03895 [Salinomyces thailandicus]|uniref:Uncharacterized protein n=1 Tax=Salinomyces thailandicus TaxID=706561 RepID=A0A4U0U0U7_9PEZI|nr:hypothetical protein B0A50_03895 [Salinomyces thailandica]
MSNSNHLKQLHWTQRIALVRHNLHVASRSGEFVFFKTLQVACLMEGTNHAATLSAAIGDDADMVLAAMDNLNAGMAYVHQDSFKNVFDKIKNNMRDEDEEADKSKLYVDITMQKNMADMAIDKMTSSAIALIQSQPDHVQDTTAEVWIMGATIVADAMEIALQEMDSLEYKLDDYIRLEESWNIVKASVAGSVTGLKGIFSLMDPGTQESQYQQQERPFPRSASIASAGSAVFRRLSNAFVGSTASSAGGSQPASRHASVASISSLPTPSNLNMVNFARNGSTSSLNAPVYRTPNYVRNSVNTGCPTSIPAGSHFDHHKLSMIPPTPAFEEQADPFDTTATVPEVPTIPRMATPANPLSMMVS